MIQDSGERRQFESGAVRDIQEGKGRCDLLPLDVVANYYKTIFCVQASDILWAIDEFQKTGNPEHLCEVLQVVPCAYELVSRKPEPMFDECPEFMWLELSKHFEEGAKKYGEHNWQKGIPTRCYIDSAVRHYLKWLKGDTDEPHDRAFVWNIVCCIWTCIHRPELNDYRKGGE